MLTAFPPNRDCEKDDEIHHWPTDGFWVGNEGHGLHQQGVALVVDATIETSLMLFSFETISNGF